MIRATAEFGIPSRRVAGRTGVWVDAPAESRGEEKTGRHRSASESLGYVARFCLQRVDGFCVISNLIVPCGIAGKRATSLEQLLGTA